MVPSEVEYLCIVLLDHLEHTVEKAGMLALPGSRFSQLPTVDDISVENKVFTSMLF